jgi:hypothetical protein
MVRSPGHSSGTAHPKTHQLPVHHGLDFTATGFLALLILLYASGEAGAGDKAVASDTRWSKDELMAEGERVYNDTCSGCHRVDGMGIPGVYPPLVAGAAFDGAEFLTQPLEARGFLKDGRIHLGSTENHIEAVVNAFPIRGCSPSAGCSATPKSRRWSPTSVTPGATTAAPSSSRRRSKRPVRALIGARFCAYLEPALALTLGPDGPRSWLVDVLARLPARSSGQADRPATSLGCMWTTSGIRAGEHS